MALDFDIVKRHPYWTGGAIVGLIVVYYLVSRGSGSSTTVDSSASPQAAAANTAANLQSQQIAAQVQTAQLSADVATNQTNAALQAQELNTAASYKLGAEQVNAQIVEALSTDDTTQRVAQIQSDEQLGLATINGQTQTSVAYIQGQTSVDNTEAQAQALTSVAAIAGQTQEVVNQSNNNVKLSQIGEQEDFYNILAAHGKLGGDSTGVATILSGIQGTGAQAIQAQQPGEVANSTPNVISAVAKPVSNIFSSLFG